MNTRLRLPAFVLALSACLLLPAAASAFSISTVGGKVVKWSISDVGYYLDPDGWSGLAGTKENDAITASFNDWQAVACAFIKFHQVGTTNATSVLSTGAEANGKSELIWKEGYWPFGNYVLGVTSPLYGYTGEIQEADIAFNGTISWNTSGNSWSSTDVKSVAIHEIGHLFGLGHNLQFNESDPPTMAPYVDPWGKSASLHQDDKNGICFLYPEGGTWSCSSDSQCPYVIDENAQGEEFYLSKYTCKASTCTPAAGSGTGALGAKCQTDKDCKSPYFCAQLEEGNWCTTWCDAYKQDCPADFACYAVDQSGEGICVPAKGDKPFGEYCYSSAECQPGLFCLQWWSGNYCTKECADVDGGTGCPSGYTCYPSPDSPGGKGGCYPGAVTKKDTGQQCSQSSECKSGMCFPNPGTSTKVCRVACDPSSPACPAATKCIGMPGDTTGKKGGCVPTSMLPEKNEGLVCEANWQCKSGYCYFDSEMGLSSCRKLCTPGSSECTGGTSCMEIGSGKGVCLPAPDPQPDGTSCQHHYECVSGFCVTLPGTSKKACRTACTQSSGCKNGFICIFYEDPSVGACMPVLKDVGVSCSSSPECTTQICWSDSGSPVCAWPCKVVSCPVGYSCFEYSPYGPACMETLGTLPVGVSCTSSSQCQSGLCVSNLCRQTCNVLAPDCPQGQGCLSASGSPAGACVTPGTTPTDGSCSTDFQCASLLCVEDGGKRLCRAPCSLSAPACAAGLECRQRAELDGFGACLQPEPTPGPEPGETDIVQPAPDDIEEDDSPSLPTRGGCSAGSAPALPSLLLLLLFLASRPLQRLRHKW